MSVSVSVWEIVKRLMRASAFFHGILYHHALYSLPFQPTFLAFLFHTSKKIKSSFISSTSSPFKSSSPRYLPHLNSLPPLKFRNRTEDHNQLQALVQVVELAEMRILSWMQQKLGAKQTSCKKSTAADACIAKFKVKREDPEANLPEHTGTGLQGWQHGLLAIGTLGNSKIDEREQENGEIQENKYCTIQDLPEFSIEELGKLKHELTKYLSLKHSKHDSQSKGSGRRNDCPLHKFLNCPSSLDVDGTISSLQHARDSISESEDQENYYVIPSKAKDVCCGDIAGTRIKQKSLTFLMKNVFACRGGFMPALSLRETQLLESRVDKLIRTILHRKIYPQNASSGKKILRQISTAKGDSEDESKAKESDRCKWVKTDSEFIVLEM